VTEVVSCDDRRVLDEGVRTSCFAQLAVLCAEHGEEVPYRGGLDRASSFGVGASVGHDRRAGRVPPDEDRRAGRKPLRDLVAADRPGGADRRRGQGERRGDDRDHKAT
jgi:hypothetical protein